MRRRGGIFSQVVSRRIKSLTSRSAFSACSTVATAASTNPSVSGICFSKSELPEVESDPDASMEFVGSRGSLLIRLDLRDELREQSLQPQTAAQALCASFRRRVRL